MRTPLGGNLLIDSLLDRLGSAQAQALLQRMDKWLSQFDRETRPRTAGGERRRAGTRIHRFQENTASQTPKDPSS